MEWEHPSSWWLVAATTPQSCSSGEKAHVQHVPWPQPRRQPLRQQEEEEAGAQGQARPLWPPPLRQQEEEEAGAQGQASLPSQQAG